MFDKNAGPKEKNKKSIRKQNSFFQHNPLFFMASEAILSFLADAFRWCGIGSVSSDNKKKE